MTKVSVVIPVHNKANYIGACLESVLSQSGIELDVVCVEDCSTDGSLEVVEDFAARDSRIKLLRNERNLGAGVSRNIGIGAATGEFLQFTDADDIVETGALNLMVDLARQNQADVVRGTLLKFVAGIKEPWPDEEISVNRCGALLDLPELWIPWFHPCFLISRELVHANRLRYPDLVAGEDPVFLAQVLTLARKICIVTDPVYSYRRDERRPPSSERKLRDFLKHIEMVKATYLPAHARCWEKYGPFALGDLEILTRKSRVAPEIKEEITRGIESLRETA